MKKVKVMKVCILCYFHFFVLINSAFAQEIFVYDHSQSEKGLRVVILDKLLIGKIKTYQVFTNQLLDVYTGDKAPYKNEQKPSIIGTYELWGDTLVFFPDFPFQPEMTYTAVFQKKNIYTFRIPRNNTSPPKIVAVYPSTDTLAENQLKFYLHFSQSMQEGHAYDFVKILDNNGKYLETPFVFLEPELWDNDRQRLTLWMDPGRIKRDLGPNQLSGTPLQAGNTYTLIIKKNWKVGIIIF